MEANNEHKKTNTDENIDVDKEKNNNENTKQYNNRTIQALKYAIAMLTIVSFFTTSNGLSKLMTDSHALIPYLISFGIQIFVLVIGTNLWSILKSNTENHSNGDTNHKSKFINNKHKLFSVFVTAAYLFSVCFSSFFSYVFLSNSVYSKVKIPDYNIEIESFINLETKNLKNINEIEGDLIKSTLRSYMPEIQNIYEIVSSTNVSKNEQIVESLTLEKYDVSKVSFAFSVDDTIESYGNLNSFQISRLNDMRNALDSIELAYPSHYSVYESVFNRINNNLLDEDIELLVKEININKENVNSLLKEVNEISDEGNAGFNNALQQAKSTAKISINGLMNAYDPLISVCERIDNNASYDDIDINKIRSLLYSVSDIDKNELESIVETLNNLIEIYQEMENPSSQNENIFSTISDCITYLGEYKKYLELRNSINEYEDTVLKQVYIINEEKIENNYSQENQETVTENAININNVSSKEWNDIRRMDLGKFISMLKSLPDTNTLITLTENTNDKYEKILKDHHNYQEDTLRQAYLISRNKLEVISAVETAILYMKSDFKIMAIFSMLMSIFIDITPFWVGTYLHFHTKEDTAMNKKQYKNSKQ